MKARHSDISCMLMRWREGVGLVSLFFYAVFLFTSCSRSAYYEKYARSLDSLSGALNIKLQEVREIDTVLLVKAISKFENYKVFITEHVKDTVSKAEADQLQQFFSGGNNLLEFSENRRALLSRGSMIASQLSKLKKDVTDQLISEEKLRDYYENEKIQAEHLIKGCYGQQQLFQSGLQEFRLSLSRVEEFIRTRNSGVMPTIIKDSIPL